MRPSKKRLRETRDRMLKFLRQGCNHCDLDEAEGDVVDHCTHCKHRITTDAYELFVVNRVKVTI